MDSRMGEIAPDLYLVVGIHTEIPKNRFQKISTPSREVLRRSVDRLQEHRYTPSLDDEDLDLGVGCQTPKGTQPLVQDV